MIHNHIYYYWNSIVFCSGAECFKSDKVPSWALPIASLVGWYNKPPLSGSVLVLLVPCTGETWIDLYPAAAILGNSFFILLNDQSKAWSIAPSLVLAGNSIVAAYAVVDKMLVFGFSILEEERNR